MLVELTPVCVPEVIVMIERMDIVGLRLDQLLLSVEGKGA